MGRAGTRQLGPRTVESTDVAAEKLEWDLCGSHALTACQMTLPTAAVEEQLLC
jgi:hypothetical protein